MVHEPSNLGEQSLDELEGVEWGPPTYDSYLVANVHRLRRVPMVAAAGTHDRTHVEPGPDRARRKASAAAIRPGAPGSMSDRKWRDGYALLERHGLSAHFSSLQTADRHPGKPHPAMLLAAASRSISSCEGGSASASAITARTSCSAPRQSESSGPKLTKVAETERLMSSLSAIGIRNGAG